MQVSSIKYQVSRNLVPERNRKGKSFFWLIISFLFFAPALVFAQTRSRGGSPGASTGGVGLNPGDAVPVPTGPFSLFGPAGQLTASNLILSLIDIGLAVAGLIAVIFLIVGGFRYVTAHGNEEKAEEAKKTITHAIIGIVIIVLSFVIVRVITNALIFGPALT